MLECRVQICNPVREKGRAHGEVGLCSSGWRCVHRRRKPSFQSPKLPAERKQSSTSNLPQSLLLHENQTSPKETPSLALCPAASPLPGHDRTEIQVAKGNSERKQCLHWSAGSLQILPEFYSAANIFQGYSSSREEETNCLHGWEGLN